MAGWHHWLNGRESEWTPGVGDGQGGLACCNSWGRKESDMTEWLNWTELDVGNSISGSTAFSKTRKIFKKKVRYKLYNELSPRLLYWNASTLIYVKYIQITDYLFLVVQVVTTNKETFKKYLISLLKQNLLDFIKVYSKS